MSFPMKNCLLLLELTTLFVNHFFFLYFSKIFLPELHLWGKRSDLLGSLLPLDPTNNGIFFPCCFLHVVSLLSLSDLLLSSFVQFYVVLKPIYWQVQTYDPVCSSPASPIHQCHLEASVSFFILDLAIMEL